MSKDNINLVEDIKYFLSRFKENRVKYIGRIIDRDADVQKGLFVTCSVVSFFYD